MHAVLQNIAICLSFFMMLSCGRTLGPDDDNDGLSNRQEERFGTDPKNPDTDKDGIPDGADSTPLGGSLLLFVGGGPVYKGAQGLCSDVFARPQTSENKPITGEAQFVSFRADKGIVEYLGETGTGVYQAKVCSSVQQDIVVVARYDNPSDIFDAVERSILLPLQEGSMPQPGLNTSGLSGKVKGFLRVFALDGDTTGYKTIKPRPFKDALVVVNAHGNIFVSHTSEDGVVEFKDPSLYPPIDVTVGAKGYRFVSYLGVEAQNVAIPMMPLDPLPSERETKTGTVEGRVIGFFGEVEGIERFPQKGSILGCDESTEIPIAIVKAALRNVPLSSISMGNILEDPLDPTSMLPVPANLVIPYEQDEDTWHFLLRDVPEGVHLVFALAGTTKCLPQAMKNPYALYFTPRAFGMERVEVVGGKTTFVEIKLEIDLRPDPAQSVKVYLGNLPDDPDTGKPLPNGLAFGVVDTGGEGYLFVTVDTSFNHKPFENPILVRFPDPQNPVFKRLGIDPLYMAVGLAGREAYLGADPPGISTPVRPGVSAGDIVHLDSKDVWCKVPQILHPAPPRRQDMPLDTLSPEEFDGRIEWKPTESEPKPDLYVVRINYLTPAPKNPLLGDPHASVGGPESHCLWEIFLPPQRSSVELPAKPEGADVWPVLKNPAPSMGDTPQKYDENTIEIELNAYTLCALNKPFDYNQDFEYYDLNVHALCVSQDSFPVKVKE